MNTKRISSLSFATVQPQIYIQMKNFNGHITSTVLDNMNTGSCTDCILQTQDRRFPCHRIILATASKFFATLFDTVTPGLIPTIIIPDINADVLQMIISMIYAGESFVPQSYRNDFIEACALLQLHGYEDYYEDTTGTSNINYPVEMDDAVTDNMVQADPEEFYTEAGGSGEAVSNIEMGDSADNRAGTRILNNRNTPTVSLTNEMVEHVHLRLENLCRKIYETKLHLLKNQDYKVELIMADSILIKGSVTCILCGEKIAVSYLCKNDGGFKQWVSAMIVRHLETEHAEHLFS